MGGVYMKTRIKKYIENNIWGSLKKPLPIRKQLSRMITLCCVIVVCIQAVVMIAMAMNQYVTREREDTLYILESDNTRIDNIFQYIGEIALSIQHSMALRNFFNNGAYDEEVMIQELKSVSNLFSERNLLDAFEPVVEKIYLYNEADKAICNLYYPVTISERKQSQEKIDELYRLYKKSKQEFYFQVEEKCLNFCMNLYDSEMKKLGTCIFVINKFGIVDNYSNLKKMKKPYWIIEQNEQLILGEESSSQYEYNKVLEHKMSTAFGLILKAGVSKSNIYKSLVVTIFSILLISCILMVLLSLMGKIVAINYVRPLETIAEKMKLVGKGNFDAKLGKYKVEELQNISNTFNEMTDHITYLVEEVYETQLIAQQLQIQYLQAQMNPHFMFNVLTMIEMKAAMNKDKEVQEMLYKLAGIYQGKIFRKDEHFIYLNEEMEIVDFYLSLQNSRFGDKITYSIEYSGGKDAYENLKVPRLSIEPIVENAVCHGLEPKEEKGHIWIKISKTDTTLNVCIEDNGVGFESEQIVEKKEDKNHTHVGLWNTNKMIHNLCGQEYGLDITSKIGKGTKVCIFLPVRNGE